MPLVISLNKECVMKTTDEIIALLRDFKARYAEKYGIEVIGLFGSVARGEQREDSDVDIAYEGKPDILFRSRIKQELEKLLDCKVDVVRLRRKAEDETFENNITKDMIYV